MRLGRASTTRRGLHFKGGRELCANTGDAPLCLDQHVHLEGAAVFQTGLGHAGNPSVCCRAGQGKRIGPRSGRCVSTARPRSEGQGGRAPGMCLSGYIPQTRPLFSTAWDYGLDVPESILAYLLGQWRPPTPHDVTAVLAQVFVVRRQARG